MAKKISSEKAKQLAYSVYINDDKSFVEIAEMVGYTAVSVGNWAKEGCWKDLKQALNSTSENQLKNFAAQLSELNANINSRDEGCRYPDSKEADIQIKLTKGILLFRGEADIADMILFNKKLLAFLRKNYPEKLKEYTLISDAFLKDCL
jgi:hypothetical protein